MLSPVRILEFEEDIFFNCIDVNLLKKKQLNRSSCSGRFFFTLKHRLESLERKQLKKSHSGNWSQFH